MNDKLVCSSLFQNYLIQNLPKKNPISFFKSTIDVIVNDIIFPFDYENNSQIVGVMMNKDLILRDVNDIFNNPNIILLIQDK